MRSGGAGLHRLSAVFLDRDGVINRKAPEGQYVTSWAEFEFLPGVRDAIAMLGALEVPIVVVTNQRGVARHRMTESDLFDIHRLMLVAIRAAGGRVDAVYHCPHEGGCACRKPGTGMFESAGRDLGFAVAQSVVIGDQPSDMVAAARIGASSILVGPADFDADHRAEDLPTAVRWLLANARSGPAGP